MTVHKIHTRMVFDSMTGELEEDEFYYHDTEVDGPVAMAYGPGGNGAGGNAEGGGEQEFEREMDRLKRKARISQRAINVGGAKTTTRWGASANPLSGTVLSAAMVSVGLYGQTQEGSEGWGNMRTAYNLETRTGPGTTKSVAHAIKAANLGTGAYSGKSTIVRRTAALRMLRRAGVTDGASYLLASFGTAGVTPTTSPVADPPPTSGGNGSGNGGGNGDVGAISSAVSSAASILASAATGYGSAGADGPNAMWPGAPSWVKTFSDYQRWIRIRSTQQGFYSTILAGGGGSTISGSTGSATSSYVTSLAGS